VACSVGVHWAPRHCCAVLWNAILVHTQLKSVLMDASYTSFNIFQWKVVLELPTYILEHPPVEDASSKQVVMHGVRPAVVLGMGALVVVVKQAVFVMRAAI
jgi:hypothetical protein